MAAILTRLLTLHPKRIDLSLDRMWRILDRLGHPERRLPPVIHVAGTNGKGSTVAFLRAILEAAGFYVHVYTSPHLMRFNERIRLARPGGGALVDDDELADALATCERLNAGDPITFFEITTAAAFLLFARRPADVLLLEVGLGGRLDATNVIGHLLASVITPISRDHEEFLGNTIELIAAEKAGIFKPNVLAVTAPQSLEALAVIERQAARLCAPLRIGGKHWGVTPGHGRMVYWDETGRIDLPPPCLFGRHQFDNAGTAIATLQHHCTADSARGLRARRRQSRVASAHATSRPRRAGGTGAGRQRGVARRRPQSGLRPCTCGRACRS
ncbi:Mur ligase family protein [Xanthobacter sp. KR7-65]|uniref:bifunctional folylpolyglutamate synthase/dihydrofolate synthase n=1 Tax=Xanthobacter sp. KR7-65 TaxID=3156612 RepID=UPI0032B458CF